MASLQELLRARRMLMERSTEDDIPTSRLIREGFDQFLADLTREREALDISQRTMPLDVCAFCVQFLPSTYNIKGDAEEVQRTHSPANYSVRAAPTSTTRRTSGGEMNSCLIIQHQFPSRATTLGKSPRTVRIHRPRSSRPDSNVSVSPRSTPTFRLLSKDATRVLRIESPAALDSLSLGQENVQHRRLLTATDDVMGNLQLQENQQMKAILRAEGSKREVSYRQRASTAALGQQHARERSECRTTGSVDARPPHHQNIIDALIRGSGTLYTGVVVAQQEKNPPTSAPRTSVTAKGSKVVTKKYGRHFKTELFFPAIPVVPRAAPKR
ncbi:hypothetical protein V7S43_004233 [Phytophthora oleae]|uniref:Uncharacterized protein n=1 Tax=Phytophthora oleae TaxID=2107226 RepID=A0ABD3FZ63_9STRA